MANFTRFDGPIPGENYTSDTRNYPWHRPPDITDIDKGVEFLAKNLTQEESAYGIISLISAGVDIASIVDMIITAGIGGGKWTPDFGLLLAGPCAHIIVLMCKGYGVEFDLGINDRKPIPGKSFFNALKVDEKKAAKAGKEALDNIEEVNPMGGFMSMGSDLEGMPE